MQYFGTGRLAHSYFLALVALMRDLGGFSSQDAHGLKQLSVTPVFGDLTLLLALSGTACSWCTSIYAGKTPIMHIN